MLRRACADEEVIPQDPHAGDHMANGRVERAVREVIRECGTCASQMTVRYSAAVSVFAGQVMNKNEIW